MRQHLTEELFNQWVYEEVQKLLKSAPLDSAPLLPQSESN
jgi:hypothetical protein